MTLQEIKTAVEAGKTVCWSNTGYKVIKDMTGQWFVKWSSNGNCTGLTWADGVTMDYKEEDFFIDEPPIKHSDWEGEVIDIIGQQLDIPRSDAQGIVEAQDFYMTQSWSKDLTPDQTAELIIDKSKSKPRLSNFEIREQLVKELRELANAKASEKGRTNFWDENISVHDVITYPAHFIKTNYMPEHNHRLTEMAQLTKGLKDYGPQFREESNKLFLDTTIAINKQIHEIFKGIGFEGGYTDKPSKVFPNDPYGTQLPNYWYASREQIEQIEPLIAEFVQRDQEHDLVERGDGILVFYKLKAWAPAYKQLQEKYYNLIKANND
jgi:hypothetical protein